MTSIPHTRLLGSLPLILLALLAGPTPSKEPGRIDFSRDVLPILSDNCFQCHGPDAGTRKGKLRLDTQEGALRKQDPVIVPGQSADSELIRRITGEDGLALMPPPRSNKKLTARQLDTLRRWIEQGANWGKHWAFEEPRRLPVPKVRDAKLEIRNPIDAFLLARLEREGLKPSAEAPREALIRRLSLDLTGLPPSPAEVKAFVEDVAPLAVEKLVDRLLASPHYGERMVWDWLDAARYADSNGYQGDAERTMWPWRDWVVSALNRNLPFDQFTVWQLAGDLLPGATREQKLATGFARNHMINGEGGRIPEENRIDYVMDMTETAGTIWLGLTFNCCRCHDHKFDPLAQRDYYGLFAFFNQTPITGAGGDPQTRPVIPIPTREQEQRLGELDGPLFAMTREVTALENDLFPRPEGKPASESRRTLGLPPEIVALLKIPPAERTRGQLDQLEKYWLNREPFYAALLETQRTALEPRDAFSRGIVRVMVMEDLPKPRDTFLLSRGSYEKPGAKVNPGVPEALQGKPRMAKTRLELAQWLVAPDNPLTARVTVNRVWQQFFGTGLVKTPEDFGVQGEKPAHPELLDWLAVEFRDSGWDVKKLHRLLVTSAAYRQSSKVTPELLERDPENRLLARGPRYRLPSWMLRDQALAVSGLLVPIPGGPAVRPYQPPGIWEEATFGTKRYQQDTGEALYRRSLYTFWRRIIGPTPLFDTAPRQVCTVKPTRTNSPLHALTTLNDVTYVEAARALAERVLTSAGPAAADRIDRAFRLVLARKPTATETQVLTVSVTRVKREFALNPASAMKFLSVGESRRSEKLDPVEHATWAAVCSAILNLDEALSKE